MLLPIRTDFGTCKASFSRSRRAPRPDSIAPIFRDRYTSDRDQTSSHMNSSVKVGISSISLFVLVPQRFAKAASGATELRLSGVHQASLILHLPRRSCQRVVVHSPYLLCNHKISFENPGSMLSVDNLQGRKSYGLFGTSCKL